MFKIFIHTLTACLITGSLYGDIDSRQVLNQNPNGKNITEGVIVPIPESELQQKWTLAYQEVAPDGSWILEWVPKGEVIDNWSELLQLQFLPFSITGRSVSASELSKQIIEMLKEKFPNLKSSITERSVDNVLVSWTLSEPSNGEAAQDELAEIISTPKGIYRVAYTKKVPQMDSKLKDLWSQRLSQAKVAS